MSNLSHKAQRKERPGVDNMFKICTVAAAVASTHPTPAPQPGLTLRQKNEWIKKQTSKKEPTD